MLFDIGWLIVVGWPLLVDRCWLSFVLCFLFFVVRRGASFVVVNCCVGDRSCCLWFIVSCCWLLVVCCSCVLCVMCYVWSCFFCVRVRCLLFVVVV